MFVWACADSIFLNSIFYVMGQDFFYLQKMHFSRSLWKENNPSLRGFLHTVCIFALGGASDSSTKLCCFWLKQFLTTQQYWTQTNHLSDTNHLSFLIKISLRDFFFACFFFLRKEVDKTVLVAYFILRNGTALTTKEVETMISVGEHFIILKELGLDAIVSMSSFRTVFPENEIFQC